MSLLDDRTRRLIERALAEDLGSGDWTSRWTIPEGRTASARVLAKAEGVIAGTEVAREVFRQLDPELEFAIVAVDGSRVASGDEVLRLSGSARSILSGERVALNFLQRLSGIATLTARYVERVAGTGVEILDTRKTTPGMRLLEKAAVRAGGGTNHRTGLFDMVLIKENHITAAGGISAAVEAVRRQNEQGLTVEVETTNLDEVEEAVRAGADIVLLDNMPPERLRRAVTVVRASSAPVRTEASGGIDLTTVREVAETEVDMISIGALTHSAPALDLSLLIDR